VRFADVDLVAGLFDLHFIRVFVILFVLLLEIVHIHRRKLAIQCRLLEGARPDVWIDATYVEVRQAGRKRRSGERTMGVAVELLAMNFPKLAVMLADAIYGGSHSRSWDFQRHIERKCLDRSSRTSRRGDQASRRSYDSSARSSLS